MFLTTEEMKDVLYSYQADEIAEGDEQIIESGILAGVSEVKAYFTASNQRQWSDGRPKYDVNKIFGATGPDRDPFVLRMCKTVAAWNICELSNVDIIYDHVRERYENVIKTLEKIAGMGAYKDSPTLTPDLPTIEPGPDDDSIEKPFRFGSRPKFSHE
jgi:phage gp36-like protein